MNGFTAYFEIDLRKFKGNPLNQDTVFGRPQTIGVGDVFEERDALREALEKVERVFTYHRGNLKWEAITDMDGKDLRTLGEIVEAALAKARGESE